MDVARAESHQAVYEVIEQHLNQRAKVNPKQTGGQESQDQVGESGQDSNTQLTMVCTCNCRHMAVWCYLMCPGP